MKKDGLRVWEIDFLRGLLMCLVIVDHFFVTVSVDCLGFGFSKPFWQSLAQFADGFVWGGNTLGKIRLLFHYTLVFGFVVLSGVSTAFSRDNGKRAVKTGFWAFVVTFVTYSLDVAFNLSVTVAFNVLHVIAVSCLFWHFGELLQRRMAKRWQKVVYRIANILLVAFSFGLGYYFRFNPTDGVWAIFVQGERSFSPGDYLPLLPSLGYFWIGAWVGKAVYKEKKTLFPSVNAKVLSPLTFVGRNSLWFYLSSEVAFYSVFFVLSNVCHLL